MGSLVHTKHAVVTGTGSGIGEAIARRLLDEGWRVTGLDRSVGSISAPVFNGVVIDLTDFVGVSSLVCEMSGVHAFVHAAGYMRVAPLGEVSPQDGEGMWRIHVQAAVVIANALIPKFSPQGRIVLIGSRTASGAAGRSEYAASKAALVGLARSWASELAPRGITVNIVAPGATDTPMLQDPSRSGAQPRMPPIGRFIRPEEVAALTSFLLTDDAGAITGQQIVICGGGSL